MLQDVLIIILRYSLFSLRCRPLLLSYYSIIYKPIDIAGFYYLIRKKNHEIIKFVPFKKIINKYVR